MMRSGWTRPRRGRWRSWPATSRPRRSPWSSRCASPAASRTWPDCRNCTVGGLADGDARALLDSVVIGPLDERVRDRIVAETRATRRRCWSGRARLIPGELAGGFGLPDAVAPPGRIEEGFRQRFERLPGRPGCCC